MDFVKFLNDNYLRKKEIAEYLGIAPSNITYICNGEMGFSTKGTDFQSFRFS